MKINLCLFLAYILLPDGSSIEDFFNCATLHQTLETETRTEINLIETIYCESDSPEKFVKLSNNISNDITVLQLEIKSDASWLITEPRMFSEIRALKTLSINVSKTWQISNDLKNSIDFVTNTLFSATKIEYLFINYHKEFNDRIDEKWKLPERLISFYLSNSLMNFDLKSCNNLEKLYVTNALLNKMPENRGLPHLRKLDLRNNPMRDFTVVDIARFCLLEMLALKNFQIKPCECLMLKKFVDEQIGKYNPQFELEADLNCGNVTDVDCPRYNLDEAIRLRKECFSEFFWRTVLLITVVLIVLACICLCGVMTSLLIFGLVSTD